MIESGKVSVIIPAYNMADYLGDAVKGILDQTYQNFEIIVINDASTDHTDQVMKQFDDPRIKYMVHSENRYAAAARNTGIQASDGEFIAFVDADDKVHPEKLSIQVRFLEQNSEIGLSYCSRIEIDQDNVPLTLVPAPPTVSLKDLVLGYPFAPSEIVMRREWVDKVGLFDESFRFHGEDPEFHMRLALSGCKMAGIQRVLNYRRLHDGRHFKNLKLIVKDEVSAFEKTFIDPLCPVEISGYREKSLSMLYRIFSFVAFSQNETDFGQELIRKAVNLDGDFFTEDLSKYIQFLVGSAVRSGGSHEMIIRNIVLQLPPELEWTDRHTVSAISYGYLLRWARDFIWGRIDSGRQYFEMALSYGLQPNEIFIKNLTMHLKNHEDEFGAVAISNILDLFILYLEETGNSATAQKLLGNYMINKAFHDYHIGKHSMIIPYTVEAIQSNPSLLLNRGVFTMLVRSAFNFLGELFVG